MSEWRDVMNARAESDQIRRVLDGVDCDGDVLATVVLFGAQMIAAEIRALATLIDFARGDAR